MSKRRTLPEGKAREIPMDGAVEKFVLPPEHSSRYRAFIAGDLPVEDLTTLELVEQRFMDKNGILSGRPPEKIPHKYTAMLVRELTARMNQQFRTYAVDAIDTIADVMNNGEDVRHQKRLDAAKYVVERVIGPIPQKMEITENVTIWQGLQEGDGLLVDIEADEIEVEVVQEAPAPAPRRLSPRTARSRSALG